MDYAEAKREIEAGRAKAHSLWILLSDEHQRDGFALKPATWQGPGEYQRVSTDSDDFGVLVYLPLGQTLRNPKAEAA